MGWPWSYEKFMETFIRTSQFVKVGEENVLCGENGIHGSPY